MTGNFPGADRSIRMEDFEKGQAVSRRYRNRRIGEFLKELDLAEARSTGVPKIYRAMRQNGSPDPTFESDEDRTWFLVRLPVHERFSSVATGQVEHDTGQDNLPENRLETSVTPQDTPQVARGQALPVSCKKTDLKNPLKPSYIGFPVRAGK